MAIVAGSTAVGRTRRRVALGESHRRDLPVALLPRGRRQMPMRAQRTTRPVLAGIAQAAIALDSAVPTRVPQAIARTRGAGTARLAFPTATPVGDG